jgi:hypothetical protein
MDFKPLGQKLMVCGPKNSLPKFQPSIRSKSARIKTRAEKEPQRKSQLLCFLHKIFIRADLLRIEG